MIYCNIHLLSHAKLHLAAQISKKCKYFLVKAVRTVTHTLDLSSKHEDRLHEETEQNIYFISLTY